MGTELLDTHYEPQVLFSVWQKTVTLLWSFNRGIKSGVGDTFCGNIFAFT